LGRGRLMGLQSAWRLGVSCIVLAGLISCTPWEVTYLEKAVDHASQADVRDRFGAPHATKALSAGGSEWTYQYRSSAVGPMGGYDTGDAYCREYLLTFDDKNILRGWRKQQC
jgi:hypothetical protein